MTKRLATRWALAAAVALGTGGCGDDDDTSADTVEVDATSGDAATSTAVVTAATTSGSSAPPGTTSGMVAGTPDPCALVPEEALLAVFGDPAPTPRSSIEPTAPLNLRQCEWSSEPSDTSLRAVYLSVQTTEGFRQGGVGGGQYIAADQYEAMRSGAAEATDVTGLADAAFFAGPEMTQLHVLSGDTFLTLDAQTIGSEAEPITADQLRALMEAVLTQL
jgi:hypothetical protein